MEYGIAFILSRDLRTKHLYLFGTWGKISLCSKLKIQESLILSRELRLGREKSKLDRLRIREINIFKSIPD